MYYRIILYIQIIDVYKKDKKNEIGEEQEGLTPPPLSHLISRMEVIRETEVIDVIVFYLVGSTHSRESPTISSSSRGCQ